MPTTRPTFRYALLAFLFAVTVVYQVRYIHDILRDEKVDLPLILPGSASNKIVFTTPAAAHAGIHPGDLLVALNGVPYTGTEQLGDSLAHATPGVPMREIALEVAQRERMNREVEIAREVQERLFPQKMPAIAGLDYAGHCRPALGVGGDYYDFLALPQGHLGLAIGDVSGKGIAAALMMASLQASLRGEATRAPENLAFLVANVNRLVYEASSDNRYATFFYGQYDPATHKFDYVNAGHNPPMVFHLEHGKWTVTRLDVGGAVVGLLESYPYQQGSVLLAGGDILAAYTDGISEAMNHDDQEWGEERMMEAIQQCDGLSASETMQYIFKAADAFVAGAQQHDDMTLVVLRVVS